MNSVVRIILLGLFLLTFSACGPKVSSVGQDGCYEIVGDEVVYTCKNDSPDNPRANTGYMGPYNPKALNLYRPGRFENVAGW
ncbi:MAG: hypothetical protein DHS20C13_26690 [Thermodesulfobacteriota bacterium]|nr:MAG: hypothetical protein DHS20C13_26690 [Thermodesulfobacteriota bacterium]